MNTKLAGKNVLITAGAQGIGEAITKHFIDSGANVSIHYFSSAETAHELVQYAINKGQKAISIKGDLTNESDVQGLVEQTVDALGGLNILINNAGSLVARKMLHEMEAEFWQKVMDINLTSMMYVTRAAAAHLEKNENSSIVNLASLAGRKGGHPGSLVYATSKGAIEQINKNNALNSGLSDIDRIRDRQRNENLQKQRQNDIDRQMDLKRQKAYNDDRGVRDMLY